MGKIRKVRSKMRRGDAKWAECSPKTLKNKRIVLSGACFTLTRCPGVFAVLTTCFLWRWSRVRPLLRRIWGFHCLFTTFSAYKNLQKSTKNYKKLQKTTKTYKILQKHTNIEFGDPATDPEPYRDLLEPVEGRAAQNNAVRWCVLVYFCPEAPSQLTKSYKKLQNSTKSNENSTKTHLRSPCLARTQPRAAPECGRLRGPEHMFLVCFDPVGCSRVGGFGTFRLTKTYKILQNSTKTHLRGPCSARTSPRHTCEPRAQNSSKWNRPCVFGTKKWCYNRITSKFQAFKI